MYPSKVIFSQEKEINVDLMNSIGPGIFEIVFSPKQNKEELCASFEAMLQSRINENPDIILGSGSVYGLSPSKITLEALNIEELTLPEIMNARGTNIKFKAKIAFHEVQLVGMIDNKYMIANNTADLWSDYTEVIYVPKELGLEIKKIRLIE